MENITNLSFIVAEYEKIMQKKEQEKEKRKQNYTDKYVKKFIEKFTDEEWAAKKAEYNRVYYEKRKQSKNPVNIKM